MGERLFPQYDRLEHRHRHSALHGSDETFSQDHGDGHDAHDHGAVSGTVDHGELNGLADFTADHGDGHDAHDHATPIAAAVKAARTNISSDTADNELNTDYQWGTEEITFTNPGHDVVVLAWLGGHLSAPATATIYRGGVKVAISLDGQSFTTSVVGQGTVQGTTIRRGHVAAQFLRSGTPTGDIVVRPLLNQIAGGVAGDLTFGGGTLEALLVPA